jgi:hypothetical protein
MRFAFIRAFFSTFLSNPLGKGILDTQISASGFQSTLLHNQYLTFILAGGVVSLVGIFLWLSNVFSVSKFYFTSSKILSADSFNYAAFFSIICFMFTLLTIEYSGLLFYLLISLLIYLVENHFYLHSKFKMRK